MKRLIIIIVIVAMVFTCFSCATTQKHNPCSPEVQQEQVCDEQDDADEYISEQKLEWFKSGIIEFLLGILTF